MPTLSTQAILSVLEKPTAHQSEYPIESRALETEYALAEAIDARHLNLQETDLVIVSSGRSGFSGIYQEAADKFVLCANEFDPNDTLRRMIYGVNIAKKCAQHNKEQGVNKPVYVYFNGVQRQNAELKKLLRTRGEFNGYPAELFIIDEIPFDNTLGQVLGLSYFLDRFWPDFSNKHHLSRAPNLVITTSSYHVPRVTLAHGANSPLLTSDFWHQQPMLTKKLSPNMLEYISNPGELLKKSALYVIGCDRKITANPYWNKDLKGDMEARVRYAFLQNVPSIASKRADNDRTVRDALALMCLYSVITNKLHVPLLKTLLIANPPVNLEEEHSICRSKNKL